MNSEKQNFLLRIFIKKYKKIKTGRKKKHLHPAKEIRNGSI